MYKNHTISLVIPCLNEEEGIGRMLVQIPKYIDEVLVVDNGSTDRTGEVARKLGAKVVREPLRGYGRAYKAGIPNARGDIIVTMDGDLSYPLTEIEIMLDPLVENTCDFVSGARFPLKNKSAMPVLNKVGNFCLSLLTNFLFFKHVKDAQSGMWAFKKNLYSQIIPMSNGMGFTEEIKINAFTHSPACFAEVAISYHPRVGEVKLSRFRDGALCVGTILRSRFRKSWPGSFFYK